MSKILSVHHISYFLSGMFFWKTLVHLSLQFSGLLPFTYWGMTITHSSNLFVTGGAAVLCILFLMLATKYKCGCRT